MIEMDPTRTILNLDGEPLVITYLGERDAIEVQTTGPIPRSVHKNEVHLVLGPDEVIQGKRARNIRDGHTLKTAREGDAKVKRVRGHSIRSKFRDRLYEVNATGELHGVLIEAGDQDEH